MMDVTRFEGRVALADIAKDWSIPPGGVTDGSIEPIAAKGFFLLSPDGKEATLSFSGQGPHYQLGIQRAWPGPVDISVFGVSAGDGVVRLGRCLTQCGEGESNACSLSPVFVNTAIGGFAACLDDYIWLDQELDKLCQLTPSEWGARHGEEAISGVLTQGTRRIRAHDPAALGGEANFWFSILDGLWGELIDDGLDRFERIIGELLR